MLGLGHCARAQTHTHSLLHKRGHCLPHTAPVQRPSPAPTVCIIFCPRPKLPTHPLFLTRLSFFSGKHRTPFNFKIHTRRGCPFSLTPLSTALVPFFCANIRYFRSRLTNRPPPPCRPPQTNQRPPAPPTSVSYRQTWKYGCRDYRDAYLIAHPMATLAPSGLLHANPALIWPVDVI